ncbi:MAG: 5-dehydro-4-deoxy-D-glucuronate isomerase [Bacteroidota bacterium]
MNTAIRFASHPEDMKSYTTDKLRERYLIESLFIKGEISMVYSMHDRMMTMGISPENTPIELPTFEEYTKATYFLQRRELGIINIGGKGKVTVDGQSFELAQKECLYVGLGKKVLMFESVSADHPAEFYVSSCPAHQAYPTQKAALAASNQVHLGSTANSNERSIYQYIHEDGIQSCQLVMGFTTLREGNVWNTFPPHTHLRRMETYCYFDLPEDQVVVHFMGDPSETRHLILRNKQAVISPEWSIHAGAGTSAYSFIWSMAGENKAFTDMDGQSLSDLK